MYIMRITALQPQARDANRVNIFVDGSFLMGASALIVLQLGLRVNQDVTPELLGRLRSEEAIQQTVERALNYLSFRPRSREEMRRYLQKKETPVEMIETVLERLDHSDLLNDHAFAEFWIESRDRFNPKGAQAIKHELRMKGVQRDVVDELVDAELDDERAIRAGRKKALSLIRLPDMDQKTFRDRLGPYLQRRGFGYGSSSKAVRALWDEVSTSGQDENAEDAEMDCYDE